MNLKNFEYEIESEWAHDEKEHILSFGNYSSSFKVANLNITSNSLKAENDATKNDEVNVKEYSNDKQRSLCQDNDYMLNKYGENFAKICSYLNVVEIKVEDIDVKVPEDDIKFYCAAMTLRFNALSH